MNMTYKNLKKVFHMYGEQKLEHEYQIRQEAFTTFLTNIEIHPIRDQKQCQTVSYPLYICMSKTLVHKMEDVLLNSNQLLKLSYAQPPIALQSYLDKLLINELQSTNEKENVRSTKAELAELLNNHQGKKNKKFQGLVKQYQMLGRSEIEIKEISDFRHVYDMLLAHDIEQEQQPDGKNFRTEGVGVYDNAMGKWIHRNEFDEVKINDF